MAFSEDILEEARATVVDVMRGRGGRGALFRLNAAKMILDKAFLAQLSDEALLAEVKRRADRASAASSEARGDADEATARR